MSYKDKSKQKEFQRKWMAKRREDWFTANGPCIKCGSFEDLELDHIDRLQKVTHNIWSWSAKRQLEELSKCQVLCKICHVKKTWDEIGRAPCGTISRYKDCRCDLCKAANTERMREYRAKKRQSKE